MKRIMQLIVGFGIWFKVLISELASNIISVILVLLLYLVLWQFPQTLDLLLVLNQNDAVNFWEIFTLEVPLYFSLLLVIGFFIWNAPKYYYRENYKLVKFKNIIGFVPTKHYRTIAYNSKYSYNCKYHIRKVLPRILACLVLFMSAFAILNAIEQFGIKNDVEDILTASNALLVVCLIFVLLLEFHVYNFIRKLTSKIPKIDYIIIIILVLLFGTIIILGVANNQSERDLTLLFFSNLALAFIFFIIAFNSQDFLSNKRKPVFYGSIIVAGLVFLLVYIILNINPELSRKLNPISVILICLIALYTISFLLVFAGKKLRFPLFAFVSILAFVLASWNANRESFKHYTLDETTSTHQQIPLKEYIYNWIVSRENKILEAQNGSYPVVFVSSEGGGSRAGLWAFLVHSYLSETSKNTYYNDYLFSLTGASGGNVGNALFFATAQQAKESENTVSYLDNNQFAYKASTLYSKNYLSSSVVGFLGRDFINNVLGFLSFKNRGELLQNEWQEAHSTIFNPTEDYLNKDVHALYQKASKTKFVPPLLFLNSAHAQTGQYSVISPVDFSEEKYFSGYYDFMKELKTKKGVERSIKLSEAMRINAAFPYLTPTGEIKDMGSFGDAGYYDNIGGTVTLNLIQAFNEVLNECPEFSGIKNKINIKSLLIKSDLEENKKTVKPVSQLQVPLHILLNVRSGHTKEVIRRLNQITIDLKRTDIIPSTKSTTVFQEKIRRVIKDSSKTILPVLPLGRYLSGTAIESMEAYLKETSTKQKLDSILQFNPSFKTIEKAVIPFSNSQGK